MIDQLTVITTYRPASSAGRSAGRVARPASRPAMSRALQPFGGHGVARRQDRPVAFYQERAAQWGGLISTAFEAISSRAVYDLRARIQQVGINIGMRAYMGLMIFFVLTQVMEFHAPGWVGVLPVLLLGGVALSEERRKRVEQRRYQASEAVAQHIGKFADRAARESEELLRGLELGLGSAYRGRVEVIMARAN
jgi:hypothetical protein